ncbi:MAG: hypothetical protein AB1391_02625 [Candidatus Micrarchaeota archaeon]
MIPNAIDFVQFRHFRYADPIGRFFKVKQRIRSLTALESFLDSVKYRDAFYSVSKWLNPHKLGKRAEENEYETCFLGADLLFDIDFKPFSAENVEKARKEAIRLADYLHHEKRVNIKYIAFSGGKGFHISCKDDEKYFGKPHERESAATKSRISLVTEIENLGIRIDSKITTDMRRIVRIPGTINSSTGYICRVLNPGELLNSDARQIIGATPRIDPLPLPKKSEIQTEKQKQDESDTVALMIKSNICGTKRTTLILQYSKFFDAKSAIRKLRNNYRIQLIFVMKKNRVYYIVSPIALDMERMVKISSVLSKSDNARYLKYGYCSFPADAKPVFFNDGESKDNSKELCSRAHLGFLEQMFSTKSNLEHKLCGKESLIMAINIIE